MSGDGIIDGHFTIKQEQGISSAICDELGITSDEAKKLGSTWNSIFNYVIEQQNENIKNGKEKIYTKGSTWNGNSKDNFVVQVNQVITFSKAIWTKIVDEVNKKLNKNIKIEEQKDIYDNEKVQKTFNDANTFLKEVSEMEEKPNIDTGVDEFGTYARCKLDDGRGIKVYYDIDGNIVKILINNISNGETIDESEVLCTKDKAKCNLDYNKAGYESEITSGYNFDELKNLAEKIFNEKTNINNLIKQQKDDVITNNIPNENATKNNHEKIKKEAIELAKNLKSELESNDVKKYKVKKYLDKITETNVSYVIEEYPELLNKIDEKFNNGKKIIHEKILTPLLTRVENLGMRIIYSKEVKTVENSKDLNIDDMNVIAEIARRSINNQVKETIDSIDNAINNKELFNNANKFLAFVANIDDKSNLIEEGELEEGGTYARCKLSDGRWIGVTYDEKGEIKEIYISHKVTKDTKTSGEQDDYAEIIYAKDKASYNTDNSNFNVEGNINSSYYDFDKLKELVEKIFGKKTVE